MKKYQHNKEMTETKILSAEINPSWHIRGFDEKMDKFIDNFMNNNLKETHMEQFKEEQLKTIDTIMHWFRHNVDNWNTKGTCRRSVSVEKDGHFDILNMEYTNEEHNNEE